MIGVYGGTFDPIHFGHLRTAVEVKEIFDLEQLLLLPSHQPPHRGIPGASPNMRLEMLQLAIKNQPGLQIDTRELDRAGPSYMVDTLESLRESYPERTLLLFMGMDAFNGLSLWYRWQALFDFSHLVVMDRPEGKKNKLSGFLEDKRINDRTALKKNLNGKLYFQKVTQLDISASKIRKIFANKKNPAYLLPNEVISYIQLHQLYQDIECKQTSY